MKNRVLVMNGTRVLQSDQEGKGWKNEKVEKAGLLKPGLYNIYLATLADQTKTHTGPIVHIDKESVYQQIGQTFIKHDVTKFDKLPEVGSSLDVKYEKGEVITAPATAKLRRGVSR